MSTLPDQTADQTISPHPLLAQLRLDRASSQPLGQQLARRLRALIEDAALAPASELPTVRALAAALGLNYNTVAAVYRELAATGWLDLRRGAGTSVAATPPAPDQQRRLQLALADLALAQAARAGLDLADFAQTLVERASGQRPWQVALVAETKAEANELAIQFNRLVAGPLHLQSHRLGDFDPSVSQGHNPDLIVTTKAVIGRAQQAQMQYPTQARPRLPLRLPQDPYRAARLRLAEGAD
jgi:DNA-binding transcriptional regulator YhcF (GntR family)